MAHPDDAEILCGGTLLKLAALGHKISIVTMSLGECGSRSLSDVEIVKIRESEAQAAAKFLGGRFFSIRERDLEIYVSLDTIGKVTTLLRKLKPDVIITHHPKDYQLDHINTSTIVQAACFQSTIPNVRLVDKAEPLNAIPVLYHSMPVGCTDLYGEVIRPSIFVDITDFLNSKKDLLAIHKSQFEWLKKQHGINDYLESLDKWGKCYGDMVGVKFAEGFIQQVGHPFPTTDLLNSISFHKEGV